MKSVIVFVFLLILVLNTNCCAAESSTDNEYVIRINTGNIKMEKFSFEGVPVAIAEEVNNEVPSSMLTDVLGPTQAVKAPKKEAPKESPIAEDEEVSEDDE